MRISDLIKMGLKNLSRRKARTALTVIGVIIGTISIVVMVSIGMGMNASYESQVMQSGSLTTIDVYAESYDYDEESDEYNYTQQTLNNSFIEMVEQLDHVKAVTPYINQYVSLTSGKYQANVNVYAFDSSTMEEFAFPDIVSGEGPTDTDKQVFICGSKVFQQFYNPYAWNYEEVEIDPAKDRVKFGFNYWEYNLAEGKNAFTTQMRNIAIMDETDNWEYDYAIYLDIDYYTEMFQRYCKTLSAESRKVALKSLDSYQTVKISVDSVKNVKDVQEQIEDFGYKTSSLQSILEPMQETSNMLQLVLGCIGGVSMLVSAISIANTMIMSIYERTKEIGVMKVLGCYVRDIKKLFLFESAMIGFIGGALGIGCSYLASWAINKYGAPIFQSLMQNSYMYDTTTTEFSMIPFWLPFLALGFAMFVGVVSGYYPARRATKISAIEAMKTEG